MINLPNLGKVFLLQAKLQGTNTAECDLYCPFFGSSIIDLNYEIFI